MICSGGLIYFHLRLESCRGIGVLNSETQEGGANGTSIDDVMTNSKKANPVHTIAF